MPLPSTLFELSTWRIATVTPNYHIGDAAAEITEGTNEQTITSVIRAIRNA